MLKRADIVEGVEGAGGKRRESTSKANFCLRHILIQCQFVPVLELLILEETEGENQKSLARVILWVLH